MMAPDETPTNLKPPRRRRWLRRALIAFAVVFSLVIIAVLAGFWRLSHGPVELGFLEPRLDKALLGTGDAPSVQIRNPVMTWGGWRRPLDLRAGPIRVIDPEGRSIVELEEASLGLAVSQLLRGRISPTRIELERLWVQLVRTEDGRVAVGFEARDTIAPLSGHTRLGIETALTGPLRTALEIIDSKPLELLAEPPPQPEQFSGTAVSHLVRDDGPIPGCSGPVEPDDLRARSLPEGDRGCRSGPQRGVI